VQSLTKIGFDLLIKNNNKIESLAGLDNLAAVQGEIMLHNNYALATTRHLTSLAIVKVGVDIYGNENLVDMHGFRFIQEVMVRFHKTSFGCAFCFVRIRTAACCPMQA
jgi:hypothetical protein